jgi:hypothetical protein
MTSRLGARFWIEAALAALSGFLFLLTLVWRDWIEAITGYDPDHHNGSAEWAIVAVLLVATIVFGLLARTQWRTRTADPRPAGHVSAS